jgi:hypothetical protein
MYTSLFQFSFMDYVCNLLFRVQFSVYYLSNCRFIFVIFWKKYTLHDKVNKSRSTTQRLKELAEIGTSVYSDVATSRLLSVSCSDNIHILVVTTYNTIQYNSEEYRCVTLLVERILTYSTCIVLTSCCQRTSTPRLFVARKRWSTSPSLQG